MAAKAPVEVFSATFADRVLGLRTRVSDSQATHENNLDSNTQKDAKAKFYTKYGGTIYVSICLQG